MKNKCHKGRKHSEKRRNCLLQAICPFLTMFFYRYISLVRQNAALYGDGLSRKHLQMTKFSTGECNTILSAYTLYRHLE